MSRPSYTGPCLSGVIDAYNDPPFSSVRIQLSATIATTNASPPPSTVLQTFTCDTTQTLKKYAQWVSDGGPINEFAVQLENGCCQDPDYTISLGSFTTLLDPSSGHSVSAYNASAGGTGPDFPYGGAVGVPFASIGCTLVGGVRVYSLGVGGWVGAWNSDGSGIFLKKAATGATITGIAAGSIVGTHTLVEDDGSGQVWNWTITIS